MRRNAIGVVLAALGAASVCCSRPGPYRFQPQLLPPPAGPDAPGLPPVPLVSPRNASYTIEARLDPDKHTIAGSLVLDWRNTSEVALSSFPFHLYWNAFRNNLSTTARGEGRRRRFEPGEDERRFGWIEVRSIRRVDGAEEDLGPTRLYLHEDGDAFDRTVMEVRSARPVAPGASARFRIEWDALEPYGDPGRAGWVHDYNFVAQWFPKVGVVWHGAWNAHPFYPTTEFFSDFGVYDVRLTLPRDFVVGATGRLQESKDNPDGTRTLRFVQEDVHDFAWTASRRFRERRGRFEDLGYPPVEIRLLVQPEHEHLAARYVEATKVALRDYGAWAAPYPYPQITVVDPAWGSASGGMEYPTLFTGGASILAPRELQSPEGVTVHEAGHQFWYGLVANNEFEEAWLDEGFNTYMTSKALHASLGEPAWGHRVLDRAGWDRGRLGWPVVERSIRIPRGAGDREELREGGKV
ncbi:MAG TPA: M1 family metallopeptidase, partial [Vicinamibacteria bacterium]|nr:M1 family metallopeptidase [Vicinamibacteria bacterium]